jgi:hypothetical protein
MCHLYCVNTLLPFPLSLLLVCMTHYHTQLTMDSVCYDYYYYIIHCALYYRPLVLYYTHDSFYSSLQSLLHALHMPPSTNAQMHKWPVSSFIITIWLLYYTIISQLFTSMCAAHRHIMCFRPSHYIIPSQ